LFKLAIFIHPTIFLPLQALDDRKGEPEAVAASRGLILLKDGFLSNQESVMV
jgi:hypothetical protein